MPSQHAIERFTLAFHRHAVRMLLEQPELRSQAIAVLDRWEANDASPGAQRYRDEWRRLLQASGAELEMAICVPTEHAATLRSMSPLGFILDDSTRMRIRREAMAE